jgi:hypothetical protein
VLSTDSSNQVFVSTGSAASSAVYIGDRSTAKTLTVQAVSSANDMVFNASSAGPSFQFGDYGFFQAVNSKTGLASVSGRPVAVSFISSTFDIMSGGFTGTVVAQFSATTFTLSDGMNIVAGSTTGTKIGTATTQKLGFFNATPIVQPASTTDLRTVLINLGLLASGGASPLNLNGGALTAGSIVAPLVQNAQTGTTYTLVLGDAGKLVELSNASAITLTVPTNASVAFPIGTQINLLQTNTGQVTVAGAGGVTVNGAPGLKLTDRWSAATLIKRATDTWVLTGRLSA